MKSNVSVRGKKVVLIAPSPYNFCTESNAGNFVSLPSMPLAIVALGSFLQKNDIPVELIDVQMDFGFGLIEAAERKISKQIVSHLCEEQTDISWVGISCLSHPHVHNGLQLGKQIKAALPQIPLIFGGYFPSGYYHYLIENYPFIDGIVYGDGEVPALEISCQLAQGNTLCIADLPNWVCQNENGELLKSHALPPLDPNTLPMLDFTLLRYYEEYQIGSMLTSRGCPFHCGYCVEPSMRSYRPTSLIKLAQEISLFSTILSCERMFIYDPLFGLGRQRTRELVQLLKQTKFKYILESRADVLEPDLIADLELAGVECISLGLESASCSTLLRMNKIRNRSRYEKYINGAKKIIAECFSHNITVFLGIMLGYPGDTKEDTQDTLDFLHSIVELHEKKRQETGNAPGFVAFPNYVKVYPRTQLLDSMQEHPETCFRAEKIPGEYLVTAPSTGYTFGELREHFELVEQMGVYTRVTEERMFRYVGISLETFLINHPDLVQDDIVNWRHLGE